jgi:hypothetical protein
VYVSNSQLWNQDHATIQVMDAFVHAQYSNPDKMGILVYNDLAVLKLVKEFPGVKKIAELPAQ